MQLLYLWYDPRTTRNGKHTYNEAISIINYIRHYLNSYTETLSFLSVCWASFFFVDLREFFFRLRVGRTKKR